MSFAFTTEQIRNHTKAVTRRLKWLNLKAGQSVCAVVKSMGLKKGEHPEPILENPLFILDVRREPLNAITQDECAKEGFPEMTPAQFVEMFCRHMRCKPETIVTRIEFIEDAPF